MNSETTAKLIIALGLIISITGAIFYGASKLGLNFFHLPGDVIIKRGKFTFYFPWVTCLVLSVVLTLFFYIFGRK